MTSVPSSSTAAHPGVSPFRSVLLRTILLCLLLAQATRQQVVDTRQSWDRPRFFPANSVYEQRENGNRANDNFSLPLLTGESSRPTVSEERQTQDEEEYDDYSVESEIEDDPTLFRNHESIAVHRVSREKLLNETTVFHSGKSNETDYSEYQSDEYYPSSQYDSQFYYDDYDNNTQFESLEDAHPKTIEENPEPEPEVSQVDLVPETDIKSNTSDNFTSSDSSILIGEAIVSVVTTKSVVNGTISVPVTSLPQTTEQIISPPTPFQLPELSSPSSLSEPSTTEDSERILASVQTSRSISGARFLPFPGIDPLQYSTETTSQSASSSLDRSTESIIDKLDRVQSELSSGFLATSFGSSGNNIQLDLPDSDQQNTHKFGTTLKTPVIGKFVPRRYNDRRLSTTTAATKTTRTNEDKNDEMKKEFAQNDEAKTEGSASSTTESASLQQRKLKNITSTIQNISAFLPPGYKLKKEETVEATEKSLLSDILAKSKVDISALLPPGYKRDKTENSIPKTTVATSTSATTTTEKNTNSSKKPTSIHDLFARAEVDISALLPKDYKLKFKSDRRQNEEKHNSNVTSTTAATTITTTKSSGIKLVFPSRPGGRKPIHKITTPQSIRGEGPGAVTPRIQKGWPTRATTEFTGWPKPSTTPISIEKLLEAARTATVSSLSNTSVTLMTSIVSSTSTTTTTTTTPRPTTPGICVEECEVAGTIRIVGNAIWVPELLDRNTREWQDLANKIEKEMNIIFSKSQLLSKWFKDIRIDSFSQGSILVDYFIELTDLQKPINTQQLKVIFHESLRTYNLNRWNDTTSNGTMRLGPFIIDPKFTDFIAIPKPLAPQQIENDNKLIPQWAIAVIVIGVGGLLFIIVFGVSVLANRQSVSKLKPSVSAMYEEEVAKNIIQTSNAGSMQRPNDYPKTNVHSMWSDPTPVWTHDKTCESTSSKILMDGPIPFQEEKRYNLYDSWRSEWNGYYYNPSHTSSRYARYDSTTDLSRHHPDYDTNF